MIPGFQPRLTYALIAVCVLFGVYSSFGASFDTLRPLLITNYVDAGLPEVASGQWWRLLTPVFIHFGIFHLGLNMVWTWQLGALIEFRRGAIILAALVVVSAVLSNVAEFYASGPLFGGMSGVIFALLGYLWIQGRFNPGFGIQLNRGLVVTVMIWFAVCWSGLLELLGIHIANWAHTVGLASGVAWGFLAVLTRSERL